jgi:hypothetical protein
MIRLNSMILHLLLLNSAIAFSKIILPHLAILLWTVQLIKKKLHLTFYFLCFSFCIFIIIQIVITQQLLLQGYALYALSIITMKVAMDIYFQNPVMTEKIVNKIFYFYICIGLFEAIFGLHWPTSPLSEFSAYFGRSSSDLSDLSSEAVTYVDTMPTGFLGNPNTYSVFIFLCYVYLFNNINKYRLIISLLVLFLIISAGARLTLIGFAIFHLSKLRLKYIMYMIMIAMIIYFSALDILIPVKLEEMIGLFVMLWDIVAKLSIETIMEISGSIGTRIDLTINGWHLFIENLFFGNGPQGVVWNSDSVGVWYKGKLVSSLHNTTLEILMDMGIVGAILILLFLFRFEQTNIGFLRFRPLIFLSVFIVVNFSASSLLYSFPNLVMIGVLLASAIEKKRLRASY